MKFTLNGKTHTHNGNGSLSSLLKEIGADKHPVAVIIDNNIIKMTDKDNISLHDGAVIEIITYAAGG